MEDKKRGPDSLIAEGPKEVADRLESKMKTRVKGEQKMKRDRGIRLDHLCGMGGMMFTGFLEMGNLERIYPSQIQLKNRQKLFSQI